MTRTIFTVLFATVFIALIAVPLLAQETVAPPRFFIERIEVRNAKRVTLEVIISESRLREGHEYSEEELRDASTRLSRLPFLLSADFSLEKGAERGKHVLVITISETKPFFFALDGVPILKNEDNVVTGSIDLGERSPNSDTDGVVGMRFFVGRRGALHFGIFGRNFHHDFAGDYSAFAVGYTQYDLFGTRAFATFNLKSVFGGDGGGSGGGISPQVVVGVPLSPNQTLTFEYDDTNFGTRQRTIAGQHYDSESSQRIFTTAWTYNTTNHPFLPTRGMLLQAKPMVSWSDSDNLVVVVSDQTEIIVASSHSRAYLMELSAARYWELSERNSVSAALEGGFGYVDGRNSHYGDIGGEGQFGIVRGGFSHSLWDRNRMKDGDSRLELNVRLSVQDGQRFNDSRNFEYVQQISASWVRRSSWGTLRLGAGYGW